MKVFAGIDGGTIVSSPIQEYLNVESKEYEIDHIDQLVILDGKIVVDENQPNRIQEYKKRITEQNKLEELRQTISNYITDRELYNNGIIDSINITEEEYKNILTEFKELKDKLS
jgi:hypothetical protein